MVSTLLRGLGYYHRGLRRLGSALVHETLLFARSISGEPSESWAARTSGRRSGSANLKVFSRRLAGAVGDELAAHARAFSWSCIPHFSNRLFVSEDVSPAA